MASSVDLTKLPEVSFADADASKIESAIITKYEELTGVTLQRADPVRLFLECLAYVVSVQNGLIDLAGKMNLLAYAVGPHLDHLGALVGVSRIAAQPARTTLRFTMTTDPLAFDVPIPAGTRAATTDGSIMFATQAEAYIVAGEMSVDAVALCTQSGDAGTGLAVGQVCRLVDPVAYSPTVENVEETTEGADEETDDRLRERIRIAPESYTVAGSRGAYEAAVLAVSSDIEAVSVYSSEPGVVDIRFVLTGGVLPDDAMIALVEAALDDETVRPLTDKVVVAAPDVVDYEIKGTWYLRRSDSTLLTSVTTAVAEAVEEYRLWQRSQPGRDINPSQLVSLVCNAGAKRVKLDAPRFTEISQAQLAVETSVSLEFGGLEDE